MSGFADCVARTNKSGHRATDCWFKDRNGEQDRKARQVQSCTGKMRVFASTSYFSTTPSNAVRSAAEFGRSVSGFGRHVKSHKHDVMRAASPAQDDPSTSEVVKTVSKRRNAFYGRKFV